MDREAGAPDTGTVQSGDVTLFYRRFGGGGGVPLLILHGANYFDSADWIEVATALGRTRPVAALDARGFGQSGWSTTKDYADEAHVADIAAVLDHLGWRRAALLGHSRGGLHAMLFAARWPHRSAALVLGDSLPIDLPAAVAGAPPRLFPTLDALLAATSRDPATPGARVEAIARAVDGGYILGLRDPDFAVGGGASDLWAALAAATAPTLLLLGSRSDRVPATALARVRETLPRIETVTIDAGHDLAGSAPAAVVDAVTRFLGGVKPEPGDAADDDSPHPTS